MASWDTGVTASTFDAGSKVQSQAEGRNRDTFNPYKAGTGFNTLAVSDREYSAGMTDNFGFDSQGDFYGQYTDSGDFFNGFESNTTGYNIIGIDGNQVGNMISAVNNYVENVQSYLENAVSATRAEIATAFRGGEAEKAVDEYLEKVKKYVHNLVSTLNAFGDKLADVGNAWVAAQSNIASNVNSSTGDFSEGNAYSPEIQYNGPSR